MTLPVFLRKLEKAKFIGYLRLSMDSHFSNTKKDTDPSVNYSCCQIPD